MRQRVSMWDNYVTKTSHFKQNGFKKKNKNKKRQKVCLVGENDHE